MLRRLLLLDGWICELFMCICVIVIIESNASTQCYVAVLHRTFPYVPTHLHYIMLELLKNSMRATVEYHGVDADYPPIKVVIADGSDNEDVIVKVSDEGGGIPRSNMKRIWSYVSDTRCCHCCFLSLSILTSEMHTHSSSLPQQTQKFKRAWWP